MPWPGPLLPNATLGVYLTRSSKFLTLSCDSVSPEKAWIVSGTFWMLSLRRCAVTTMSPSLDCVMGAAALSVAATAGAAVSAADAAVAPSNATSAQDRR